MSGSSQHGLSEPPEGALAGETVPRENDEEEVDRALLDEAVGILKTRPEYHGRSDDELREIARDKLRSD